MVLRMSRAEEWRGGGAACSDDAATQRTASRRFGGCEAASCSGESRPRAGSSPAARNGVTLHKNTLETLTSSSPPSSPPLVRGRAAALRLRLRLAAAFLSSPFFVNRVASAAMPSSGHGCFGYFAFISTLTPAYGPAQALEVGRPRDRPLGGSGSVAGRYRRRAADRRRLGGAEPLLEFELSDHLLQLLGKHVARRRVPQRHLPPGRHRRCVGPVRAWHAARRRESPRAAARCLARQRRPSEPAL